MFKALKNTASVLSKKVSEATGNGTSNENPEYVQKIKEFKATRANFKNLLSICKEACKNVDPAAKPEDVLIFFYQYIEPTEQIRQQYEDARVQYDVCVDRVTSAKSSGNAVKISEADAELASQSAKFFPLRDKLGAAIDNIMLHRQQAHSDSVREIAKVVSSITAVWTRPAPVTQQAAQQ
jgi:Zn-dependent M32 family carboxypeptidase